jgi:DNA-binding CsgD family transcriptional regulator
VAARTTDSRTARELREIIDLELATRQIDVLAPVALGLTNDRIASSLALSLLTVKSYLRSAMARLDALGRDHSGRPPATWTRPPSPTCAGDRRPRPFPVLSGS